MHFHWKVFFYYTRFPSKDMQDRPFVTFHQSVGVFGFYWHRLGSDEIWVDTVKWQIGQRCAFIYLKSTYIWQMRTVVMFIFFTCCTSTPVFLCGAAREHRAAAACCLPPVGTDPPPADRTQPQQTQNTGRTMNTLIHMEHITPAASCQGFVWRNVRL